MKIHLAYDNHQHGPYSRSDVEQSYRSGSLPADALAWIEGQADWIPLGDLMGFPVPPPIPAQPAAPATPHERTPSTIPLQPVPPAIPKRDAEPGVGSYFLTTGRIGRGSWFLRSILHLFCFGVLMAFVEGSSLEDVLTLLLAAAWIWMVVITAGKRLHDMDTTAWVSFIVFVPLAGFILLFVTGTDGPNKYGPQPTNAFLR